MSEPEANVSQRIELPGSIPSAHALDASEVTDIIGEALAVAIQGVGFDDEVTSNEPAPGMDVEGLAWRDAELATTAAMNAALRRCAVSSPAGSLQASARSSAADLLRSEGEALSFLGLEPSASASGALLRTAGASSSSGGSWPEETSHDLPAPSEEATPVRQPMDAFLSKTSGMKKSFRPPTGAEKKRPPPPITFAPVTRPPIAKKVAPAPAPAESQSTRLTQSQPDGPPTPRPQLEGAPRPQPKAVLGDSRLDLSSVFELRSAAFADDPPPPASPAAVATDSATDSTCSTAPDQQAPPPPPVVKHEEVDAQQTEKTAKGAGALFPPWDRSVRDLWVPASLERPLTDISLPMTQREHALSQEREMLRRALSCVKCGSRQRFMVFVAACFIEACLLLAAANASGLRNNKEITRHIPLAREVPADLMVFLAGVGLLILGKIWFGGVSQLGMEDADTDDEISNSGEEDARPEVDVDDLERGVLPPPTRRNYRTLLTSVRAEVESAKRKAQIYGARVKRHAF